MSLGKILCIYLRATGADEQRVGVPRYIVNEELWRVSIIMSVGNFSNTYLVIDAIRVPA